MNEKSHHSIISEQSSEVITQNEGVAGTDNCRPSDEVIATRSTYASFYWLLYYTKMFATRLTKDLFLTLMGHFYDKQTILPNHIVELMRVQQLLHAERESHVTFSSEDDEVIEIAPTKVHKPHTAGIEREPMFVIVDSSCSSNPSSKELLIENQKYKTDILFRRCTNKKVTPLDLPSTSKDFHPEIVYPQIKASDSVDELQMIDINLQSENEIPVDDEVDNESIVISYLKNRDALADVEELSESSLDANVPSFPSLLRIEPTSMTSLELNIEEFGPDVKEAIEFLQEEQELLIAAETGNEKVLQGIIAKGANVQQRNHLGQNALHLAVTAGNTKVIKMLLNAGVNPNVKDSLGMTPLSICLMRRPSVKVAKLLFDHGAQIMPRVCSVDTGLLLQFVMMCSPTREEEKILRLLLEHGALINDPEAPGGRQALHFAAMSNNCELIEILVDLGADLFIRNHRNETPKEVALTFQCRNAYNLLAELEDMVSFDTSPEEP